MNAYQAAQHYQKVLKNVAEEYAFNEEDAEIMKGQISLKRSDELDGRYGRQPKVIWENMDFGLGAYELETEFGWIDLTEYGLKEEAARHAEPYNRAVLCFYS